MANYYRVPTDCPDCDVPLVLHTLGVAVDWSLAVNFACPKCKREGGHVYDMAELVLQSRIEDGEEAPKLQ